MNAFTSAFSFRRSAFDSAFGLNASFTGALDDYASGLAGVWASRRLLSSYSSSLAEVRRSSDSTALAIGYTASGALDGAAMATFCGGGSGFFTKLYNQVTASNDMIQASAASQPAGFVSGSPVVDGVGNAIVRFDGSNDVLRSAINPGATKTLYFLGAIRTLVSGSQTFAAFNGDVSILAQLYANGTIGDTFSYYATEAVAPVVLTGQDVRTFVVRGVVYNSNTSAVLFSGATNSSIFDPSNMYDAAGLTVGGCTTAINPASLDLLAVLCYATNHDSTQWTAVSTALKGAFGL